MIQPIQHLKQPQCPRSLDGSGVVHVVKLLSPLALWSRRALIAEINKVCVFAVNDKVCVVINVQVVS